MIKKNKSVVQIQKMNNKNEANSYQTTKFLRGRSEQSLVWYCFFCFLGFFFKELETYLSRTVVRSNSELGRHENQVPKLL